MLQLICSYRGPLGSGDTGFASMAPWLQNVPRVGSAAEILSIAQEGSGFVQSFYDYSPKCPARAYFRLRTHSPASMTEVAPYLVARLPSIRTLY